MLEALFVALACLAAIAGGGEVPTYGTEGCSDQVAVQVPATWETSSGQECGTGVQLVLGGGMQVRSIETQCPLFALVYPAHSGTKHSPKSETYTLPNGTLEVRRLDYHCHKYNLLGFLPITVSSACEKVGETTAGVVTNYAQYPCPQQPRPQER
jgi:hypothetical protein